MLSAVLFSAAFVQNVFNSDIPKSLLPAKPAAGQTVVSVNGVAIKTSDVDGLLWEWFKDEALKDLISYQVIKGAAEKDHFSVTDDEVNKELVKQTEMLKSSGQIPNGTTLEQWEAANHLTPSRLFIRMKADMLLKKLALKSFKKDDYVDVATLQIKPVNESQGAIDTAAKAANEAYDRLNKGESWSSVFASYNKDPQVSRGEGKLGWRLVSAFPSIVKTEFETLKTGGVTKPALTANGWQLFRLDRRGKDAAGDNLDELETYIFNISRAKVYQQLMGQAKIERTK